MGDQTPDGTPDGMPPGWPFGAGFDLSQMMRMLQSTGPINWEIAGQVASSVAISDPETGTSGAEPSWTSADAQRLTELVRIAQTHVAAATGLAGVHRVDITAIGRQELARRSLHGLRPVLEALAITLQGPLREEAGDATPPVNPLAALSSEEGLTGLLLSLAPTLLGVQAGTMAGYLGQQGLSRYELLLPLSDDPELAFVVASAREFSESWELEIDDVLFALAIRETVRAAQRTVAWVGPAIVDAATDFVSGYEAGGDGLERRLAELDVEDAADLQGILGDPTAVLGMMRSPVQDQPHAALRQLASVLEGYTDVVVQSIGAKLLPSFSRVDEALRRRRVTRGPAGKLLDQLLGLDLSREHYEQGRDFCAGVIERAGLDGLNRLWDDASRLPTTAEIEAPGLWLARLDL